MSANIEKAVLRDGLRNAFARLEERDIKAIANPGGGYGGMRFRVPEEDIEASVFPKSMNSETASAVFNNGVRQLCMRSAETGVPISQDTVDAACDSVIKEIEESEGEHRFVFSQPQLILSVEEEFRIGKALFRRASESDAQLFKDKNEFLKRDLGTALIELRCSGCHLEDEFSIPAAAALTEYQRAQAFLVICRMLLSVPEAHADRGLDFNQWPRAFSLVGKHGATPLTHVRASDSSFPHGELEFAIDSAVLEQFAKACSLESFNKLCQTEGELRDKIYRSLDWFRKALGEDDPTDRLVCLFISFESLMAMGGDALNSQTDDLAENIALLIHPSVAERIDEKSFFKKKVYPLRNRILHHGHSCEPKDAPVSEKLVIYITKGLVGILKHLDEITRAGGLRNFFEKAKMSASI